ncbi:MAG: ribosome silencing factor [Anaerolineae bacterium]|nr:ribosome silencing factor [Anaerolineae bacterium]
MVFKDSPPASQEDSPLEPAELARAIVNLATDKKGEDIVLMDMRQVSPITDYFIIVSAMSDRQLKAIIEHVTTEIKKQHSVLPWHVEGNPSNGWVLVDYADVVVHGFLPERRAYYDLEGLWREAPVVVHIR